MKGIFHDTRELRDLIIRHPELPLVFHVDSDMSGPDCELHDCAIWTMVEDGEIPGSSRRIWRSRCMAGTWMTTRRN